MRRTTVLNVAGLARLLVSTSVVREGRLVVVLAAVILRLFPTVWVVRGLKLPCT